MDSLIVTISQPLNMPFLDLTFALCLETAIYIQIFGFFTEPKKVRLTWLNLNYTSEKAHFLLAYNQFVMIVSEFKPPYSFFVKHWGGGGGSCKKFHILAFAIFLTLSSFVLETLYYLQSEHSMLDLGNNLLQYKVTKTLTKFSRYLYLNHNKL